MEGTFFAMMSRMKYIERWALMRNTMPENISEHSLEVAMIAHSLAIISNKRFGNSLNPEHAACIAMFHDATEIITGDMPTPIKYYNGGINEAFKEIEDIAARQLIDMLPADMKEEYESIFFPKQGEEYLWKLVKAADKISAYIKCVEERKVGNTEFRKAEISTLQSIKEMKIPEAEVFFNEFIPAYSMTLDELT